MSQLFGLLRRDGTNSGGERPWQLRALARLFQETSPRLLLTTRAANGSLTPSSRRRDNSSGKADPCTPGFFSRVSKTLSMGPRAQAERQPDADLETAEEDSPAAAAGRRTDREDDFEEVPRLQPNTGCAAHAEARRLGMFKALGDDVQDILGHIEVSTWGSVIHSHRKRGIHTNTFSAHRTRQRFVTRSDGNRSLRAKLDAVIGVGLEL